MPYLAQFWRFSFFFWFIWLVTIRSCSVERSWRHHYWSRMRSQLLRHPKHSAVKSLSNVLSFFKSKTPYSGDPSFLFFWKKKLWESIVWALAVGISQSCVIGGVEVSCSNYYVINFFWLNKIWLWRAKWIKKEFKHYTKGFFLLYLASDTFLSHFLR